MRHCDVTFHENVIRIYTKFCRSLTFVISKRANMQTVFVFFVRVKNRLNILLVSSNRAEYLSSRY